MYAYRIELRDDPQRYHAAMGIRVEEAWSCVCIRCKRVAVKADAADRLVVPASGNGYFEAMCSLQPASSC